MSAASEGTQPGGGQQQPVIWRPREGRVVFLDTETTGLDPAVEQVFEIAVIDGVTGDEHVFRLEPEPHVVAAMHPKAVEVNRYHERTTAEGWRWDSPHRTADKLRNLLQGAHIVGAVPDFDARFLTAWFGWMGQDVPRWHYHLIDIEVLAAGWLLREPLFASERAEVESLPIKSDRLSELCGVEPVAEQDRHTALGDARWVMRWWNRLHGHTPPAARATTNETADPLQVDGGASTDVAGDLASPSYPDSGEGTE